MAFGMNTPRRINALFCAATIIFLGGCATPKPHSNIPSDATAPTPADVRQCEEITLRVMSCHAYGAPITFTGTVSGGAMTIAQAAADFSKDNDSWRREIYGPPLRDLILRGCNAPTGSYGWINYDWVFETQDSIPNAENMTVVIGPGSTQGKLVIVPVRIESPGGTLDGRKQQWVFGRVQGRWKVCDFLSDGGFGTREQSFARFLEKEFQRQDKWEERHSGNGP